MQRDITKIRLTREELLFRLRQIVANNKDLEADHSLADTLLLEYIDDEEVTQVYNYIEKYYA